MKKFLPLSLLMFLNSCQLIGDIFKAGFFVAIICVIIVILVAVWIIKAFTSK
jgi:hypothetical protein